MRRVIVLGLILLLAGCAILQPKPKKVWHVVLEPAPMIKITPAGE